MLLSMGSQSLTGPSNGTTITTCKTVSCNTGFRGGLGDKESACNAGVSGSTPGWALSPGEGNGYPLQHSCLENSVDRGAWWAYSPWGQKELDTAK